MSNKKLESLILSKIKSKKINNNKNKDNISLKELIRLFLFLYSVYYYFNPVKIILLEFIKNGNVVNIISNLRKLFFSIDSFYKFIYYKNI